MQDPSLLFDNMPKAAVLAVAEAMGLAGLSLEEFIALWKRRCGDVLDYHDANRCQRADFLIPFADDEGDPVAQMALEFANGLADEYVEQMFFELFRYIRNAALCGDLNDTLNVDFICENDDVMVYLPVISREQQMWRRDGFEEIISTGSVVVATDGDTENLVNVRHFSLSPFEHEDAAQITNRAS